MSRKKKPSNPFFFSDYAGILLFIAMVVHFTQVLVSGHHRQEALECADTRFVIARINTEKEFFGNSPVSREFYYKYSFIVDGQRFKGDSRQPEKQPGDTILIRYVVDNPEFNEPVAK